jgi:hypothetical protein
MFLIQSFTLTEDMTYVTTNVVGRDSSVGTATVYGLDGPGIKSRWGRDFPHPSRPAHPASCTMGTGSLSRG